MNLPNHPSIYPIYPLIHPSISPNNPSSTNPPIHPHTHPPNPPNQYIHPVNPTYSSIHLLYQSIHLPNQSINPSIHPSYLSFNIFNTKEMHVIFFYEFIVYMSLMNVQCPQVPLRTSVWMMSMIPQSLLSGDPRRILALGWMDILWNTARKDVRIFSQYC